VIFGIGPTPENPKTNHIFTIKIIKIETRQEIVLHGVRWANNILVEILANHAAAVSKEGRQALADAIRKITEAENHFRQI
jgi:hypothetical protein